jgi:3-hydroxyacyl-[acyl-carrier-protein] dehydratase
VKNKFIVDPSRLDLDHPIADLEAIRQFNPQRYEMEQLTSILYEDFDNHIVAALKVVTEDEFWVRGHMPGMPLMPGVIMLEAVAQLCGYYAAKMNLVGDGYVVGFGGVDECRFRGMVKPGDRLLLLVKMIKARPGRMVISAFQGVVDNSVVLDGKLRGVAIPAGDMTSQR